MGTTNPQNHPFHLRHVNPNLLHPCRDQPHSPPPTTDRSLHTFPHNYATKSPLVTMIRPKFTPKLLIPFDDNHPRLIQPSLDDSTHHPKRHPDPLNRFATIQFPDTYTQRQTHRWTKQQVRNISAYVHCIQSDALKCK